jgi:hypothetical protein
MSEYTSFSIQMLGVVMEAINLNPSSFIYFFGYMALIYAGIRLLNLFIKILESKFNLN